MKRYHVQTFGCQMNVHDSERIKGLLESLGMGEARDQGDADVLVFNTCTIREKADERFVAHLMEARAAKQRDPGKRIVVGGCWSESMKQELFDLYPFVDLAFGPGAIHKLGDYIAAGGELPEGHFSTFDHFAGHLPGKRERRHQAWLQISQGCNSKCSYCIVPSVRGREQSRSLDDLVGEARRLAADGVRELTLLGQNVNSWGRDLPAGERGRVRRSAPPPGRGGRDRAHPFHQPPPEGHARRRDRGHGRVRVRLRAPAPAAAVRLHPRAEGDAPHLQRRALPGPGRADPRGHPRHRPHHRRHRRLPR